MTGNTQQHEPRLSRLLIQAAAKHLPPSASRLRLLDINGAAGEALSELRGDLDIITAGDQVTSWTLAPESADAVMFIKPLTPSKRSLPPSPTGGERGESVLHSLLRVSEAAGEGSGVGLFLDAALRVLRPGGRLIIIDADGQPGHKLVTTLENAGYTRILVELASPEGGVLMRGEKPHTTPDTLERIRQVAVRDSESDLSTYTGRFIHLLIQQTPNKPVWKLQPGEKIEWRALALAGEGGPVALAFSSLPKAISFMQPAVVAGSIQGVNKVAKFSRETAQSWPFRVWLNPPLKALAGREIVLIPVEPQTAEAPDE